MKHIEKSKLIKSIKEKDNRDSLLKEKHAINDSILSKISAVVESGEYNTQQREMFFLFTSKYNMFNKKILGGISEVHDTNSMTHRLIRIDDHPITKTCESYNYKLYKTQATPIIVSFLSSVIDFIDVAIETDEKCEDIYPFDEKISSLWNTIHLIDPQLTKLLTEQIHTYIYLKTLNLDDVIENTMNFYTSSFNSVFKEIDEELIRMLEKNYTTYYENNYTQYPYYGYQTTTTNKVTYDNYYGNPYQTAITADDTVSVKNNQYSVLNTIKSLVDRHRVQTKNLITNHVYNTFHWLKEEHKDKVTTGVQKLINQLEDTNDESFLNMLKKYNEDGVDTKRINGVLTGQAAQHMINITNNSFSLLSSLYTELCNTKKNDDKKYYTWETNSWTSSGHGHYSHQWIDYQTSAQPTLDDTNSRGFFFK